MGRNQNNKKVKKDQVPSEEEVSEEELEVDEEEELDEEEFNGDLDEEDIDGDSVLLLKIEDKLQDLDDEEKLSWAAIYAVKKQQAELNEQMQKEIDAIKEKYEIQRIPLLHKISDAVAGKKLDKSIYSENQFVKDINLNKTKPKALRDYWGKVFDGCGLIAHENDVDLLQKLTSFKVDLIDAQVQNIKLTFEFEENEFFGSKLTVEVKGSVSEGNFEKKVEFQAKSQTPDENSLFGMLTLNDTDNQELCDTCHDIYRSYISSTYFYFYEPSDDLDEDEGEEGQGDDEEDSDEDEDQVKAVQKPKGSSITEKPECKQQ